MKTLKTLCIGVLAAGMLLTGCNSMTNTGKGALIGGGGGAALGAGIGALIGGGKGAGALGDPYRLGAASGGAFFLLCRCRARGARGAAGC